MTNYKNFHQDLSFVHKFVFISVIVLNNDKPDPEISSFSLGLN